LRKGCVVKFDLLSLLRYSRLARRHCAAMVMSGFVRASETTVSTWRNSDVSSPRRRSRSRSRSQPEVRILEDDYSYEIKFVEATLPAATRFALKEMEKQALIKPGDFDAKSLEALKALPENLQDRVTNYMTQEKIYLHHARTKSSFLHAACDKARGGSLDVLGFGQPDPWRDQLLQIATPRRPDIELIPEDKWMATHGAEPLRLCLDVMADPAIGVPSVALCLKPQRSIIDLKRRIAELGAEMPVNKMKLREASLGFLRNERSLAYYNLHSGVVLQLSCRSRGGVAKKHDHSA